MRPSKRIRIFSRDVISWIIRQYPSEGLKLPETDLCRCPCSLLLGIDEENRQIACGLVDTIGKFVSVGYLLSP